MKDFDTNGSERSGGVSAVIDLSLVAERQGANGDSIQSWELLGRLIPRSGSKTVAYHMHCGTSLVQAWCREPENEGGSGQPNPIDRVCHLIEAVFVFNPLGPAHIVEFITNFFRQLVRRHQALGFGGSEARRESAAELLERATAVVNSLNVVGATNHTLERLVELRAACNQNIDRVQAELYGRESGARS